MIMSFATVRNSQPGSARTPRHGYKTVSPRSEVDELLFTSHNALSKDDKFDPRWKPFESKEKIKPPLLWAPIPNIEKKLLQKSPFTKKYAPVKMVPSFVDESLFGPKIKEPDFPAPWENKKKRAVLLWSPCNNISKEDQKTSNTKFRCNTPNSARKLKPSKPIWKP